MGIMGILPWALLALAGGSALYYGLKPKPNPNQAVPTPMMPNNVSKNPFVALPPQQEDILKSYYKTVGDILNKHKDNLEPSDVVEFLNIAMKLSPAIQSPYDTLEKMAKIQQELSMAERNKAMAKYYSNMGNMGFISPNQEIASQIFGE